MNYYDFKQCEEGEEDLYLFLQEYNKTLEQETKQDYGKEHSRRGKNKVYAIRSKDGRKSS